MNDNIKEIIYVVLIIAIITVLLVLAWIFIIKPLFHFFWIIITNPIFYIIIGIIFFVFLGLRIAPKLIMRYENHKREKIRIKEVKIHIYEEKQNDIKYLIDEFADDILFIVKAVESKKEVGIDILETFEQKIRDIDEALQNFSLSKNLRRDLSSLYKKFHFSKEIVLKDENVSETVKKYFHIIDDRFYEMQKYIKYKF